MKKKCKIGDKIPKFKIPLSDGSSLDSKDIKDKKYILYFYPKDNTPCLLYTSPSPRDKRQSRMPSSA